MKQSNQGYSIILSVLMVWFMLVLTHGVMTLVIGESKDSKTVANSLKAYAAAEWALELWMLEAKNANYGIDRVNTDYQKLLFNNGWNNKDAKIQYEIDGLTNQITSQSIPAWEFAIIPLFWHTTQKVTSPVLTIIWIPDDVVWNILSQNAWLAGVGNFDMNTSGKQKSILSGQVSLEETQVWDFISSHNENYLIIQNTWNADVSYTLTSQKPWEFFTNTTVKIVGNGEVGWWKQNVFVEIDTQKYLNLLKYSVFSPN